MKNFMVTLLLGALLLTCGVLLVFTAKELFQTRKQLAVLEARQQEQQAKVDQLMTDLEAKTEYLELLDDPVFLERIVRERLGYTNPDEWIYRFPKEDTTTDNGS